MPKEIKQLHMSRGRKFLIAIEGRSKKNLPFFWFSYSQINLFIVINRVITRPPDSIMASDVQLSRKDFLTR